MYDAQGTKIYLGSVGSPEAFSQVLKVRRISDPNITRPWKDRTDLDSTWRDGIPGLPAIGEMSFEVFWYPDDGANQEALLAAFMASSGGTKKRFRIQWPDADASYMDFDGYVVSLGGAEEVDGDLVRTFTLHGTGVPVFGS